MADLMQSLDLSKYERGVRLRHWTVPVTVFMAPTDDDRRNVLAQLMRGTGVRRHETLAMLHHALAAELELAHQEALEDAFERNFGHKPRPQDYVVTCIWRDDLPEEDKERLRSLGYLASKHRLVAKAHRAAAHHARRAHELDN